MWAVLVVSHTGQLMEQTALTGSRIGARFASGYARTLLHVVSIPAVIAMAVIVFLLALWRGSRRRALWAAGTIAATNASAQLLKHTLLWRPDFGLSQRWDAANTLPSGHTAVAASTAVALVLVVGARWRSLTAWVGALLAAAMGYSTLGCPWHRPGDVMAALLLAVGWGAVAVACGAWANDEPAPGGRTGPDDGGGRGARRADGAPAAGPGVAVMILGVLGVLAGVISAALEVITWRGLQVDPSRVDAFVAYAAGSGGTVAVAFTGLALLAALSRASEVAPPRRRGRHVRS